MSTNYSIYLKAPELNSADIAARLMRFGAIWAEPDQRPDFDEYQQFETTWASGEVRNYRLYPEQDFEDDEYPYAYDFHILFFMHNRVGPTGGRTPIVEMAREFAKEFEVIVTYGDDRVALYSNSAPGAPLARHPEYAGIRNEWEWLPDGTYLGTLYAIYIDAPGLNSIDIAERLLTFGADSYEHEDDSSDDRTHLQWSWMPKSDVWNVGHWPLFFNEPGHGDGYEFRIAFHILQSDDTHESRDRVVAIANELAREFQTLVVYDDSEVALYENHGPGTPLAKLDEYRGLRSEWIYDEEGRYLRSSEDN